MAYFNLDSRIYPYLMIHMNDYPAAIDPDKVGEYPALTKSGAGYFFDEALEYSKKIPVAEMPLALIRQWEWINEPEPGVFTHEKGERITEWQVEWLSRSQRKPGDIGTFIKEKSKNG